MPTRPPTKTSIDVDFLDLPELLNVREAAAATRLSMDTIRKAIGTGELQAFIPRGRTPQNTGPGTGYRISKGDLKSWFLGDQS